jgi:hypothetical protein
MPKQSPSTSHLIPPKDWIKFVRNGAILAFVVAVLLFRNSPHTSDEIALTIVIPLVIFNCIPFITVAIVETVQQLRPRAPQKPLPFPQSPTVQTEAVPLKYRLILYALIGMIVSFGAGFAILLASFAYPSFSVAWAARPARYLSYVLLGISILPIVALLSFVAGNYYQGRLRNSGSFHWFSRRVARPINYWPTSAG